MIVHLTTISLGHYAVGYASAAHIAAFQFSISSGKFISRQGAQGPQNEQTRNNLIARKTTIPKVSHTASPLSASPPLPHCNPSREESLDLSAL